MRGERDLVDNALIIIVYNDPLFNARALKYRGKNTAVFTYIIILLAPTCYYY